MLQLSAAGNIFYLQRPGFWVKVWHPSAGPKTKNLELEP
jgi:hypothetical protein